MLKITLKIEGMMCGMCEAHTNEAIKNAWKVKKEIPTGSLIYGIFKCCPDI